MLQSRRLPIGAAAIAAALWLASSLVAAAARWFSWPPRGLWESVFPAPVPPIAWQWPVPWNVVAPAVSVLCVFAVYLGAAALASGGTASRGIRFVALWFAAVAGSVVGTAPWVLGQFIAHFPPQRAAFVFDDLGQWLQLAAWFGVAWGWLPALVALRRFGGETSGASALPRRRLGVAIIVTALVLSTAAFAAGERAERLHNATLSAIDNGKTTGAVPDPAAVVTPPPTLAPGTHDVDPSWCTPDDSVLLLGHKDAATGHRMLTVRLMNFSDHDCVLDGYPDFAFADASGSQIDVELAHGGSFMTQDAGATVITVPAGGYAATRLGWDANPTQGELVTYTLWSAAYPGWVRGSWPVTLDIIGGSTVSATAWELSDSGAGEEN